MTTHPHSALIYAPEGTDEMDQLLDEIAKRNDIRLSAYDTRVPDEAEQEVPAHLRAHLRLLLDFLAGEGQNPPDPGLGEGEILQGRRDRLTHFVCPSLDGLGCTPLERAAVLTLILSRGLVVIADGVVLDTTTPNGRYAQLIDAAGGFDAVHRELDGWSTFEAPDDREGLDRLRWELFSAQQRDISNWWQDTACSWWDATEADRVAAFGDDVTPVPFYLPVARPTSAYLTYERAVQRAASLRGTGRSLKSVARRLRAEGWRTRLGNRVWHQGAVEQALAYGDRLREGVPGPRV